MDAPNKFKEMECPKNSRKEDAEKKKKKNLKEKGMS